MYIYIYTYKSQACLDYESEQLLFIKRSSRYSQALRMPCIYLIK